MSRALDEYAGKTTQQKIEFYKNALKLEETVLSEIEKEPIDAQLAELMVMYKISILFAEKKLREGATIN